MLGCPYVEQLIGALSIPRNWIVDDGGILAEQSVGYNTTVTGWLAEAQRRLAPK
jgi:hypothetical protein